MKKRLIIVVAIALVCVLAAGGTIAWLTASASVSNTFTVGKIDITLTEANWVNNSKLYPGAEIVKDPKVTVKANSEDCYVYVMIDNQLNATLANAVSLDVQTDWTLIYSNTTGTKNVYRYTIGTDDIVKMIASDRVLPVFTQVKVSTTVVTEANIASLGGKTIEVKAYAHQANATTMAAADAAALTHFGI